MITLTIFAALRDHSIMHVYQHANEDLLDVLLSDSETD